MVNEYNWVNLPVVRQVELVGVAFAIDLLDEERFCALLTEFGVVLAWDFVSVMELDKGPVAGLQLQG